MPCPSRARLRAPYRVAGARTRHPCAAFCAAASSCWSCATWLSLALPVAASFCAFAPSSVARFSSSACLASSAVRADHRLAHLLGRLGELAIAVREVGLDLLELLVLREHRFAEVEELGLAAALRRGLAGGARAFELDLELRDLAFELADLAQRASIVDPRLLGLRVLRDDIESEIDRRMRSAATARRRPHVDQAACLLEGSVPAARPRAWSRRDPRAVPASSPARARRVLRPRPGRRRPSARARRRRS